MQIIDAGAGFAVYNGYSSNYSLYLTFCYKPMTASDRKCLKSGQSMPIERKRAIHVDGYPGPICPVLSFVLLNDWPIGKRPPPFWTNTNSMRLTIDGVEHDVGSGIPGVFAQCRSIPADGEFVLDGRATSHAGTLKAGLSNEWDWDWDITFHARTFAWQLAKNGHVPEEQDLVDDSNFLKQAVQTFKLKEERFPRDLKELLPRYMDNLPVPPYNYKDIYDPATGVVRIVPLHR
jgi:hypothetical protein